MTHDGNPAGTDSVLVCGSVPVPDPPRVVLSPGSCTTFDGDRWYLALSVETAVAGTRTVQRYRREQLRAAVEAAAESVASHRPGVVALRARDRLRDHYGDRIHRVEDDLAAAAREAGARFVVHSWSGARPRDHERFGVIVEDTGPASPSVGR